MIAYFLTFAGGALVASLWWLLRWRRSTLGWQWIADDYARIVGDLNRTIKKQEAALRLLGVIETSAKAAARQNGGTRR
jgi:hypothetical protein